MNLNLTGMVNDVLVTLIAVYHIVSTYVWPTTRSLLLAVSPIAIVAISFWWPLRSGTSARIGDTRSQD